MTNNVQDVTLEILKNIQTGVAEINTRFDQLETRFDQIETGMRKDRRNVAGMLVMMRATAGDFDERVSEVEERVFALEGRSQ